MRESITGRADSVDKTCRLILYTSLVHADNAPSQPILIHCFISIAPENVETHLVFFWFSDILRGYKNGTLVLSGLINSQRKWYTYLADQYNPLFELMLKRLNLLSKRIMKILRYLSDKFKCLRNCENIFKVLLTLGLCF